MGVVELTGNALMQGRCGRCPGARSVFYLTSELDVHDAFHDHVELTADVTRRDVRMAEALAFAHIERDREPSLTVLEQQGH